MRLTAASRDPVAKPREWRKAVRAAASWLTLGSWKGAAEAAGVSERTLRDWKRCSWWSRVTAEAEVLWFSDVVAEARRSLLRGVASDPHLALKVLERVDPRLAPPMVVYRRERDQIKELAGLTNEQLEAIESMTDEEILDWLRRAH